MDIYDIDKIINHVRLQGIDISPADRQEWAVGFCHSLKILGYSFDDFAAMSNCPAAECRKVWQAEKRIKMTESQAKAKIVYLSTQAGVEVKRFLLRPYTQYRTAATKRTPKVPQSAPKAKNTPPPPMFVSMDEVRKAAASVEASTLFKFLCSVFDEADVRRVCSDYMVGATKEFGSVPALASAFPFINASGQCVDVRLTAFETDGHRRKTGYSINWLMAKRKQSDRRSAWCLFGEHLLPLRPDNPVAVVESEKTALICAIAMPMNIWVATQSLHNFNADRLAAARGRKVYVYPDFDGIEAWEAKASALASQGFDISFCGHIVRDRALPDSKEDLADILLRLSRATEPQEYGPELVKMSDYSPYFANPAEDPFYPYPAEPCPF